MCRVEMLQMPKDVNEAIDRELALARARWGDSCDLQCIECSRGIVDDETLLRMLRYFHEHGESYTAALRRKPQLLS
jgi:hypothetical protein